MNLILACLILLQIPCRAELAESSLAYCFDGARWLLTEEEWKARLTPDQYRVLRMLGTEPPFENSFYDNKETGLYLCAGCALPLFSSAAKYESGTGWPSFFQPLFPANISFREDRQLLTPRTEVSCSRCGGHLGHAFSDGPPPTGMRYCMNSAALQFIRGGP